MLCGASDIAQLDMFGSPMDRETYALGEFHKVDRESCRGLCAVDAKPSDRGVDGGREMSLSTGRRSGLMHKPPIAAELVVQADEEAACYRSARTQ
jgi:hypothetical protein